MKTIRAALVTLAVMGAGGRLMAQPTEIHSFTNLNRTIPDGNPSGLAEFRTVPSTIGSITAVKVKLNVAGNFNGDLYGFLTHSTGFTVLLNRPGKTAAAPGGYDDSGFDITFQDGAVNGDLHNYRAVTTPAAGSPLTGIWEPDARNVDPAVVLNTSSRTAYLSAFNGLPANGDWTLFLADLESGGTNQLKSWELQITGQVSPVLTWAAPSSITYGAALGAVQLNASAGVPGTFAYSPTTGTVLNAGNGQTLQVVFTPTDQVTYQKVTNTVSIDVLKAPLTVTAQDKGKVYGAALPALTAGYSGFVNGDSPASLDAPVSLNTAATAGSAAGAYSITASGAADANYTISFVSGTLTVSKAPLTITAQDKGKVYGAALPALTAAYSGFVNGDTSASLDTPVSLSTTATAGSAVGAYPITASGAADVNYTIGFVNGTLTVSRAALTITAQDKNKAYGAAVPALTAAYSGFVNGDTSASLDTPVSLSTTATAASAVGTYPITATGAVDANYTISFANGTLTVDKAPLTITGQDKSKVYGAALPALTAAYSGFVNGDTAASLDTPVSLSTTATAGSAAGAYPITASGAADANYTITFVNGTLTVDKAALTITAQDKSKTYGAALPALTAAYSGFVNGDTSASLDTPVALGTTATAASAVGTYPITASGAVDVNYTISFVNGTLTIGKAGLTITAQDKSKVYGAALPTLTAAYSGFVNGDTSASLDTPVALGTTATAASAVGTYPITASGAVDANYTISFANGTLTVDKAALTITAQDKSKVYGAALPALTAAYSGFVNGDTSASLDTPVTLGTTATAGSSTGTYPINASGAVDANYTIAFVSGTLTVGKAASTGIVGASPNPAQTGASVTLTLALSAVAPGAGTPTGSVLFKVDGVAVGAPATLAGGSANRSTSSLSPGTHSVTAEYAGDANFSGTTNSLTPLLTVNTPPVAGDDTITRYPDQGVKALLLSLLGNDTDADGDTVSLESISSTSAAGGVVSLEGQWVHYTPPPGYTNSDSFTYVIRDGRGGTATGTVSIINESDLGQTQNLTVQDLGNGSFRIRYFGIPGRTYELQFSGSLIAPTWQTLSGGVMSELGYRDVIDTPPVGSPTRYYRTVCPPL